MSSRPLLVLALMLVTPVAARAQMHHEHAAADTMTMPMPGMSHGASGTPAKSRKPARKKPAASHAHPAQHAPATPGGHSPAHEHAMPMSGMGGMDMADHGAHGGHAMTGLYGPYPVTREASGTAWQPDAAEHAGLHATRGAWMLMLHGMADVVADHQGGPRGDDDLFSSNMVMGTARRPLGAGTLGLRAMTSLEPATIGKRGYARLLQTGETADGVTPLIDRQHPHDLFMELAGSYAIAHGKNSFFVYGGLPGEPALGPPAFMHRFSGASQPLAPITHHWLDSTHITFGVLTAGAVFDRVKVEASAFRGREPDEDRWNIETPRLDSHAFRLSVNPADGVAWQVSSGSLHSPEQLEPDVDQDRTTVSAMFDGRRNGARWEATLAWGRDRNRPGHSLDAALAEIAAQLGDAHTVFARVEGVEKDELFAPPDARAGQVFHVGDLSAGWRFDFRRTAPLRLGAGVAAGAPVLPPALRSAYGEHPGWIVLFAHAELH